MDSERRFVTTSNQPWWKSLPPTALKPDFDGFPSSATKEDGRPHGTLVKLHLKNPTTKIHLDNFGLVLANLPTDEGKFQCYDGLYGDVANKIAKVPDLFEGLRALADRLTRKDLLQSAGNSLMSDLSACTVEEIIDKQDKTAKALIYFTGLHDDKVLPLKRGLRGIYLRIHGRLLKQSFTDSKFTYNISKWKQFESGVRVEFSIDWLRDQISLSRTGIRFSNEKLELISKPSWHVVSQRSFNHS